MGSYSPSPYNISRSMPSTTVCLEGSPFQSDARLEAWTRQNVNQIPIRRELTSDIELRRESQRYRANHRRLKRLGLRFNEDELNVRGGFIVEEDLLTFSSLDWSPRRESQLSDPRVGYRDRVRTVLACRQFPVEPENPF